MPGSYYLAKILCPEHPGNKFQLLFMAAGTRLEVKGKSPVFGIGKGVSRHKGIKYVVRSGKGSDRSQSCLIFIDDNSHCLNALRFERRKFIRQVGKRFPEQ